MTIRPTHDNVVIKTLKAETKTPGGLIITSEDKAAPQHATVIAVGPGRRLDDGTRARPEVEVGQTVIVPGKLTTEVTVEGEKCYVIKERDIFAVLGPKS